MRKILFTLLILASVVACQPGKQKLDQTAQLPAGTHKALVSEVLQTESYTYLKLDENQQEVWIAIPRTETEKGKVIYYDEGMEMKNFESKALGRTFESVYFVQGIRDNAVKSVEQAMKAKSQKNAPGPGNISVEQPQGALSIASIFENKQKHANQSVQVRGQVVKVNNNILGTNWLHIQDGSEFNGNFDLTVTTNEMYQVGDVITFMGTIHMDKDFGAGYAYDVIMEDAVKVVSQ